MSDELAPIDLATLTVLPYPHALCLKQHPPAPYALPSDTIITARTLHVPSASIATNIDTPVPLAFIFFNQYDPAALTPTSRPISADLRGALLYANGLNQLAHSGDGLGGRRGDRGARRLLSADDRRPHADVRATGFDHGGLTRVAAATRRLHQTFCREDPGRNETTRRRRPADVADVR